MKNQPALKATLIFLIGVIGEKYFTVPVGILYSSTAIFSFFVLIVFLRKKYPTAEQVLLGFLLLLTGALRYSQTTMTVPKNHIRHHLAEYPISATITGYLEKDPFVGNGKTEFVIQAERIQYNDSTYYTRGKVLTTVYTEMKKPPLYGDEMIITGKFMTPPGQKNPDGFDYKSYLAGKNIHCVLRISRDGLPKLTRESKENFLFSRMIYPLRRYILNVLNQSTHESSRPILTALLLGEKRILSPEIREDFAKTGIIHLLAVSGLHVGFVLLILMTIFSLFRIPYAVRVILVGIGLIFFALLTEGHPPVVRAVLMACIYLTGTLLERQANPFNTIGAAAFALLFIRPAYLFDVGFQLSFAAVLSIIYFYRELNAFSCVIRLKNRLSRHTVTRGAFQILLVSLAAQIGTLPFTVYYFNRIPLLSILVNITAIPLVGIIVALGFMTILFYPFSHWVACVYGELNHLLISMLLKLASWTGSLPFSHVNFPSPDVFQILAYASGILLLFHLRNVHIRKTMLLLLLVSLNCIVWKNAVGCDAGKLVWIQFDVGQGDAALLRLPRRKNILIDGGDRTLHFDNGNTVIAPYLRKNGIRKLDAMILTHPHNDHVGGLSYILRNFKVDRVVHAGTLFSTPLYDSFWEILQTNQIETTIVTAPDSMIYFPGVKLYFVSPDSIQKLEAKAPQFEANNQSIVTRIHFGETAIIFMGDAHQSVEKRLVRKELLSKCNGLKAGHHGSNTSSSNEFLQQIKPEHAVISVGDNNRYNHPSVEVIHRLQNNGCQVYRTDRNGAVIFASDGKQFKQRRWKSK